jgi:hypothetical protein
MRQIRYLANQWKFFADQRIETTLTTEYQRKFGKVENPAQLDEKPSEFAQLNQEAGEPEPWRAPPVACVLGGDWYCAC